MAQRGRPPVQHIKHVHTIALSPEVEEKLDLIIQAQLASRGISSLGRFFGSLASHPAGLAVIAGIAAYIGIRLGALGAARSAAEDAQVSFWQSVAAIGGADQSQQAQLGTAIRKANELAREKLKEVPVIGEPISGLLSALGL